MVKFIMKDPLDSEEAQMGRKITMWHGRALRTAKKHTLISRSLRSNARCASTFTCGLRTMRMVMKRCGCESPTARDLGDKGC